MRTFIICLISTLIACFSVYYTYLISKKLNFKTLNYRKKEVVKSVGFSLVLFSLIIQILSYYNNLLMIPLYYILFISITLGIVGFIDDNFGSDEYKGLRGHFKALFEGKITTGLAKAVIGVAVGAVVSYLLGGSVISIAINTLTFALMVNLFNLLDLRPGRALKVYSLIMVIFALIINSDGYVIPIIILIPAIPLLYLDLREKVLLGDAGSNVLGGFCGLLVIAYLPLGAVAAVLIVLIFLHVVSELISFTEIIEKNSLLKWFDNLGRLS